MLKRLCSSQKACSTDSAKQVCALPGHQQFWVKEVFVPSVLGVQRMPTAAICCLRTLVQEVSWYRCWRAPLNGVREAYVGTLGTCSRSGQDAAE
jgi:hypothetical protein